MTSNCKVHNNTNKDAYIDIYRIGKHSNGPRSYSSSSTWDDIKLDTENGGFRECSAGDSIHGLPGTLSWHLEFGSYMVKARDAYNRPTQLEIF
jgi:hypothetical protein